MSVKKKDTVHAKSGLVISRGVPIPSTKIMSAFTLVARDLEPNDSVVVDKVPKGLYNLQKKLGVKFTYRKEGDGFRIWRTI